MAPFDVVLSCTSGGLLGYSSKHHDCQPGIQCCLLTWRDHDIKLEAAILINAADRPYNQSFEDLLTRLVLSYEN